MAGLDPAIFFDIPSIYREYSAFGDLTYKVLPALDLTGGIRVDRVTNDRAELAATTSFGPTEIALERPRTIGAAITVHF